MPKSESSFKLLNIQCLRGVAVIMVLLYHLYAYEQRASSDHLFGDYMMAGAAGVDLFFVISGLVMTLTTRNLPPSLLAASNFIVRRAIRIYPLYWIYSLAALAVILTFPSLISRPGGADSINLWTSFLLLPSTGAPLVGQGWTLVHEMYFYSIFALILLAYPHRRGLFIAAWAILLILGYSFSLSNWNATFGIAFSLLTLEFMFGCIIGYLVIGGKFLHGGVFILIGAVGLFASKFWISDPSAHRALTFGLPCAFLVYGAVSLELQNKITAPRWIIFIGDISYSLYLSHIFTLSAGFFLWKRYIKTTPSSGLTDNIFAMAAIFFAAVLVSILSYFLIERPLMRLFISRSTRDKIPTTLATPEKL